MLGKIDAIAHLAVKDLKVARKFYEDTLGLKKEGEEEEAITFRSGSAKVFVYRSEYAGTNKATAMGWEVGGDLERIVKSLQDKGVTFEHYDMPNLKRTGAIHGNGDVKIAWFKDPDGNILSLFGS